MTAEEYLQLKAFARIDGARLSLLWIASFVCYLVGLSLPGLVLIAFGLAIATPFLAARDLRRFRDDVRSGVISMRRGWAYVVLVFFYAGLLFAIGQYLYFAYMDGGYLTQSISKMVASPESQEVISQYGMADMLNESLQAFHEMRPIDMALQALTVNISLGIVLGLPIAAMMRREQIIKKNN